MSELNFSIKLDRWARAEGYSYSLNYNQDKDCYEVEISSSTESECYHSRTNYVFESFLVQYKGRSKS